MSSLLNNHCCLFIDQDAGYERRRCVFTFCSVAHFFKLFLAFMSCEECVGPLCSRAETFVPSDLSQTKKKCDIPVARYARHAASVSSQFACSALAPCVHSILYSVSPS